MVDIVKEGLTSGLMKLLLSCISTKHSVLKKHWSETSQECPLTVLGSYKKPDEDLGGLLCLIDDLGCSLKTLGLSAAAGMVRSDKGLLITAFNSIHEIDTDLNVIREDAIASPVFSALHSISRTRSGYLVASTGLDLLVEFNKDGEIVWEWWATDHGFERKPDGELRLIDKRADHRTIKYGTLEQTTHVNSMAELPDGRILATLFHQGTVIAIDRETGRWQTVLEGLDHPHAVRILDGQHFTVADTVHGRALLVRLDKSGHIEEEVVVGTSWLQDCSYDAGHDAWILVDGKNSNVHLRRGRSGDTAIATFYLDPEWRLYEAYVL
jgi:hypothetical protein